MKEFYRAARLLSWVTQFGFSVAAPLAGCILLAVWLRGQFGLGGWVVSVVYNLLGNVPFILIQRYNRPRLQHLMSAIGAAAERGEEEAPCVS